MVLMNDVVLRGTAMSILYLEDQGAVVGVDANRCKVTHTDGMVRYLPLETLDGIMILGHIQLTTQCMETCLQRGITISYLSRGGKYFGRLVSTEHINVERQRKQCALYENAFSVDLAREVLAAKLKNQEVVLERYAKSKNIYLDDQIRMLRICRKKVLEGSRIAEMIGFEGQGAKAYFDGLSKVIDPAFAFHGRSRRPPMNPFNSMISLGYSILMNEIYSKIEAKGLNPYFGFIHRDNEKHPTLASDMMEEWRAVIVDSTAMSLINGHEIRTDNFEMGMDEPGCFLNKEGLKIFLNKLENKLQTEVKYRVSFRRAMTLQMEQLVKAIETEDASIYKPIEIR